MQSGLVSIIMPCFNQARYLSQAVDSAARQTYPDIEIVIINDGSTDNFPVISKKILEKYSDRRIKIINQKKMGVSAARNTGISESSGGYILPLDADDMIHPDMIKQTKKALDKDEDISIAYTDYLSFGFGENGNFKKRYTFEWDAEKIYYQNLLPYCSLFRKAIWRKVGGYDPDMSKGYEDWDFWLSCASHGFIGKRIREHLFNYRIKRTSRNTIALKNHDILFSQIILKHKEHYPRGVIIAAKKLLLHPIRQISRR